MPRESLDALENLPKERRCQVALGQLHDEVPRMPDEAPAGLEQPLLDQPHVVGPKAVAREPGPVGGFYALPADILVDGNTMAPARLGAIWCMQGWTLRLGTGRASL
jgi:hypothetical protein